MELQTITQVSRGFNISTRTMRYYEQIGLLASVKKDEYAYRTYDETAIHRLQQIIVLRKLRIPLKQITTILYNEDTTVVIEAFRQNVNEIEHEITALSTIKTILNTFINRLNEKANLKIKLDLLNDQSILKIVDSLTVTKINFKEEKSMEDLNKVNEILSKLKDVRIVYLPPATVAASHFYCDEPEAHCSGVINEFVGDSNLCTIKPDFRHHGFNNPNPTGNTPEGMPDHGYEMWVTIPDDMDVPEPLMKKYFSGGLYAAHMIPFGNFEEWKWLCDWAKNNVEYEPNLGIQYACMVH